MAPWVAAVPLWAQGCQAHTGKDGCTLGEMRIGGRGEREREEEEGGERGRGAIHRGHTGTQLLPHCCCFICAHSLLLAMSALRDMGFCNRWYTGKGHMTNHMITTQSTNYSHGRTIPATPGHMTLPASHMTYPQGEAVGHWACFATEGRKVCCCCPHDRGTSAEGVGHSWRP